DARIVGAVRDPVPVAISALLLDRVDVPRRLRSRGNPHVARGGAGRALDGAPDRALWTGADSGEPRAFPARHVRPDLPGRRAAAGIVVPLLRRAGGSGADARARAKRADHFGVLPSAHLWAYALR